jgi:hypothetical protein
LINKTSGLFDTFTKQATGAWTGSGVANAKLDPGTGFFVKNPGTNSLALTFVGEVPQTTDTTALTVTYNAGFNLVGSIVPQAGNLEGADGLGYTPTVGDVVYSFNPTTQAYATATRQANGKWTGAGSTGGAAPISVAQGFWLNAKTGGTWTRTFTIGN